MPGKHLDTDGDGLIEPERRIYVSPLDLAAYERVDPAEFDNFDQVDSTTVTDPGAPGPMFPGLSITMTTSSSASHLRWGWAR